VTQTAPPPGPEREAIARASAVQRPSILRAMVRSAIATTAWLFLVGAVITGLLAIAHPDTPLPSEWNPTKPLRVTHPVTPLTTWKLNNAVADGAACLAALQNAAAVQTQSPREDSAQCFIANRVNLRGVGQASIAPLETNCGIALRLAMWERHSLQPAARAVFGADVTRINQIGSYNCRRMRTMAGASDRMSTHATADAVDITGFGFSDGRTLNLINDWDSSGQAGEFLRAARDGACDWFGLTLSPDFNRLHADHFHLQSRGWGGCR